MNPIHPKSQAHQNSDDHTRPAIARTDGFWTTVVRCVFPLLVCASLSLGFQIPWFYDWSGAQQSHTPPIVGYVFAGFLIACCASLLALPLLPKLPHEDPIRNPLIQVFRYPQVAIIAAIIIVWPLFYSNLALALIAAAFLYPVVCAVNLGMICPSVRSPIASLYSCLYLPFIWVFANDVVQGAIKQGSFEIVSIILGAPALLCSLSIGRCFGQQHGMEPIGIVIVSMEVFLGLYLIQVGARRAIAYLIMLQALSVTSSCLLLALLRV